MQFHAESENILGNASCRIKFERYLRVKNLSLLTKNIILAIFAFFHGFLSYIMKVCPPTGRRILVSFEDDYVSLCPISSYR